MMEITIELFATLTRFLPPGTQGKRTMLCVPEGATVGQVLQRLGVPDDMPFTTLVNGRHSEADQVLRPGDRLTAFPPLAGGRQGAGAAAAYFFLDRAPPPSQYNSRREDARGGRDVVREPEREDG